jgi:glycosyltransferase involved in cell wall biosynthesis
MNALSITRRRVRRRAKRALETIGLQVTHVDRRYVQPSYNDQTPLPPGARDLITFLGPVDHEVLKGAFEACQAFVFPTLQDFVGRVAVEALTAGTPLVVSPMTGAVGTIVPDGVNGIVVDPRDPRALARRCTASPTRKRRAPCAKASGRLIRRSTRTRPQTWC